MKTIEVDIQDFNNILQRLRLKQYSALNEFFENYYSLLLTYAGFYLKNDADIEDVASDVIASIADEKDGDYVSEPKAWLYVRVKNRALNFLRGKYRLTEYSENDSGSVENDTFELEMNDLLKPLTPRERYVIVNHVFLGFSLKEVAAKIDVPYVTIKRIYARCKEKLKNDIFKP